MNIVKAYLLGVHPGASAPERLRARSASDRDLLAYLRPGVIFGGFSLTEIEVASPFWKERIEHIYLQTSTDAIGPYTVQFSVAELRLDRLDELVRLKYDFPRHVADLHSEVLRRKLSPRRMGGHAHPSILFCQLDPSEFARPVEQLASDAVALMGFERCAVLPAQVGDTLFTAGPFGSWEYESVCAIPLEDYSEGDKIVIPRIVYDFRRYQTQIFVLEDLSERLQRLPFVRTPVAEYLSALTTKRRPVPYSRRFLSFLKDSETTAMELKAVEDQLREVESAAQRNSFSAGHRAFQVRMPSMIRGSIVEVVGRESQTTIDTVKGAIQVGNERQRAIGDYLRDAANSEATLANLRLQRLVIVLTILTLLVGALAVIPGILTEDQKKSLWYGRSSMPQPPSTPAPRTNLVPPPW